jgi:hypothetical protein
MRCFCVVMRCFRHRTKLIIMYRLLSGISSQRLTCFELPQSFDKRRASPDGHRRPRMPQSLFSGPKAQLKHLSGLLRSRAKLGNNFAKDVTSSGRAMPGNQADI